MAVPLLLGEGGATASGLARPGEGRAKREPDRAKPKEKSIRTLSPHPTLSPRERVDLPDSNSLTVRLPVFPRSIIPPTSWSCGGCPWRDSPAGRLPCCPPVGHVRSRTGG